MMVQPLLKVIVLHLLSSYVMARSGTGSQVSIMLPKQICESHATHAFIIITLFWKVSHYQRDTVLFFVFLKVNVDIEVKSYTEFKIILNGQKCVFYLKCKVTLL